MRLDLYLFYHGLADSRTHAANLIKLGRVKQNGIIALKCSATVDESDVIEVDTSDLFASLGGIKLKKAIETFKIQLKDKVCLDIGASNGGFTDVLLRGGAGRVYALDVAECCLPNRLREDARVIVKEKINARYLTFEDIGQKLDLITIDVSFISLKLIIGSLLAFLHENSYIIALIKPQFEVGRNQLTKQGIVKSKKVELSAVEQINNFCKQLKLKPVDVIPAPKPFLNKNQEYLALYVSQHVVN